MGVVVLVGQVALVGVVDKAFLITPALIDWVEMVIKHSEAYTVLIGGSAL